jgi:transposase
MGFTVRPKMQIEGPTNPKSGSGSSVGRRVGNTRRTTKSRIMREGLRREASIAELCRKEGIAQSMYYACLQKSLEAGKGRLAGDTAREATSNEVKMLRAEARPLKEALAGTTLENRLATGSADGQ